LRKSLSDRFKLSFGADYFITNYDETFDPNPITRRNGYDSNIAAIYTEAI
jgi:hypothetical protein